jgi:hypothetical protein
MTNAQSIANIIVLATLALIFYALCRFGNVDPLTITRQLIVALHAQG